MMLSVVDKLPRSLANADCIEMLEGLLQASKNGEIICAAVAVIRPDGRGAMHLSDTDSGRNALALLGGVHCLAEMVRKEVNP